MSLAASLRSTLHVSLVVLAVTASAEPCRLADEDRAWTVSAIEAWGTTAGDALKSDPAWLPELVLFDSTCTWRVNADVAGESGVEERIPVKGRSLKAVGAPHDGSVVLPDGGTLPVQIVSFAATAGDDRREFLVMALPGVWRASDRFASDPTLGSLMRGVFSHEMTHTVQSAALGRRLDEIEASHEFPGGLDDDVVQRVFGEREGYREAYERERDLLFRAAEVADEDEARSLAREALEAFDARRARFMKGEDRIYAELDELFLMMEGVANWAAVQAGTLEMGRDEAIATIRRGGRYWTQDEGLAFFLVIDRLVPDWQARVFREEPETLRALLQAAGAR